MFAFCTLDVGVRKGLLILITPSQRSRKIRSLGRVTLGEHSWWKLRRNQRRILLNWISDNWMESIKAGTGSGLVSLETKKPLCSPQQEWPPHQFTRKSHWTFSTLQLQRQILRTEKFILFLFKRSAKNIFFLEAKRSFFSLLCRHPFQNSDTHVPVLLLLETRKREVQEQEAPSLRV